MPASKAEQVLDALKALLETARSRCAARRPHLRPEHGRPKPAIELIAGVPAIKSAPLSVTIDHLAAAPLS